MSLNQMFSKRSISLGVFSCLLLSGCSVVSSVLPEKAMTNVLSGREGANGQVLVVKIDDTTQAHPQIGLEDADIVYIEQVEGGLTRLAAVFSSVIPERVGPVVHASLILKYCRNLVVLPLPIAERKANYFPSLQQLIFRTLARKDRVQLFTQQIQNAYNRMRWFCVLIS